MLYKSIFTVVAVVAAVLLTGCGEKAPPSDSGSTFKDSRDGKTYKTVKIGSQIWFAENLNFAAKGSKCYENKDANCAKYGRLYDWTTANKACPAGYHLPTDDEWTALVNYAGGEEKAGKKLKSTVGWDENGNGTDDFDFRALPGGGDGWGDDNGFGGAGEGGNWWSATELDAEVVERASANIPKGFPKPDAADFAWNRELEYGDNNVGRGGIQKERLYSVRCVQDW